jgi:hypothetical protein
MWFEQNCIFFKYERERAGKKKKEKNRRVAETMEKKGGKRKVSKSSYSQFKHVELIFVAQGIQSKV